MKRKELINLAQKIAKQQVIEMSNETTDKEKRAARSEIMKLTSHVDSLEDITTLDELIQEFLEKRCDYCKSNDEKRLVKCEKCHLYFCNDVSPGKPPLSHFLIHIRQENHLKIMIYTHIGQDKIGLLNKK